MPALDLSRHILSASADYRAGDWASVSAAGSLDARVGAVLKRGRHRIERTVSFVALAAAPTPGPGQPAPDARSSPATCPDPFDT
jgi:hypothetical protein